MLQDDYLLKLVRRLAEFVAEVIARAVGLASQGKPAQALELLAQTCGSALGMEYEVLAMVDARSAIDLLGAPERGLAFIRLVEAMAQVEASRGEPLRAQAHAQHALDLAAALTARHGRLRPTAGHQHAAPEEIQE